MKKVAGLFVLLVLVFGSVQVSAKDVGNGVDWEYGGNYWTTIWSKTRDRLGNVKAVKASVSKNGVFSSSNWEPWEAYASKGGVGSARAYYDYK
ncbi:MAG: hypothetical protein ACRC5R_01910 [Mycoplasmatales bacterium]